MACLARPVALAALATTLTVVRLGLADDGGWFDPPAGPTQPPPHGNGPPPDLPPHVVPQPNGGVIVHRTPEEGVDVDAPTPSGRVRAYGCGRVEVDPSDVAPPGPPPCAVPTPPPSGYGSYRYPTYPGPHYPGYGPPSGGSYSYPYAAPYGRKPREPSDPARRAALVTSSLLFGLGTVGAGSAFVVSVAIDKPSEPALYTLGGVLTLSPSLPRFVVGDWGVGLLLTAVRGGSFAAGAFVDWKDETYILPTMLSFVVPFTVGIVDLATTPKRKRAEPQVGKHLAGGVVLTGAGPSIGYDLAGKATPSLGVAGLF
jgi:hypothetical protein